MTLFVGETEQSTAVVVTGIERNALNFRFQRMVDIQRQQRVRTALMRLPLTKAAETFSELGQAAASFFSEEIPIFRKFFAIFEEKIAILELRKRNFDAISTFWNRILQKSSSENPC